jgi:hypothetical protein
MITLVLDSTSDLVFTIMLFYLWIILIVIGLVSRNIRDLRETKIDNIILGFGSVYGIIFSFIYLLSFNSLLAIAIILLNVTLLMFVLIDFV